MTKPWTILLVDDEEDVLAVSRFVLKDVRFEERGLRLLEAQSAREAREIFEREHDIALAFIDVVMETEHAGLDLIRHVRETLGNRETRLIIRTGNPGAAPQGDVVSHFEIDDYTEKTELTARRLQTAVVTSLRSYRNLCSRIELERGLELIIDASSALHSQVGESDLLRLALDHVGDFVATIIGSGVIADRFVVHRTAAGARMPVGAGRYAECENRRLEETLPAPMRDAIEAAAGDTSPNIAEIEGGLLLPIRTHRAEHLVFWVATPRPLSEGALRIMRVFLSRLGASISTAVLQREVLDAQSDVLNRLCGAVELRSKENGAHIRRIALYARRLARLADLTPEEVEIITAASPMHDIGKVVIPDRILNKPGRLDEAEWSVMKSHAEEGHNLLANPRFPLLQVGAEIALSHHERWDGSGYPRGLSGQAIPRSARIVAIVDVFDALLSARPYKAAWPLDRVLAEMAAQRGRHFDPELLDLLLLHAEQFHEIFTDNPNI
jgi:response regulator RpfG family c-di-GMP phosphodiesterase